MKRARTSGGSVTGGTGDVKPQILTLSTGIAPAVGQYVVGQVSLPVARFGGMKTKTTVIEMLWVDWYLNLRNTADATTFEFGYLSTSSLRVTAETVNSVKMEEDVGDPRTFAYVLIDKVLNGGSGQLADVHPQRINLTDMNGNGILIATDTITIVGGAFANQIAGSYIAKVCYRTVNIGISEYVGIVQSQQ